MKPEIEEAIKDAREIYCRFDLQIDPNPAVREADDGVWVAAWVRVDKPPTEDVDNTVKGPYYG